MIMIFLQNCFGLQHNFLILKDYLYVIYDDLEPFKKYTMKLDENLHVHLSISNCIFIVLRLSFVEIKVHISTFITESL